MIRRIVSASGLGLGVTLLLITPGCTTQPSDSATGTLRVWVSMTGEDVDLDGYTVQVDNGPTRTVRSFGIVTFADLSPGSHQVELGGIAANCVAVVGSRISVTVHADSTSQVAFAVSCAGTGLLISVPTTGLDPAPVMRVLVDGVDKGNVAPNSNKRITRLSPGAHEVTLDPIAPNCSVSGSHPRSVVVISREVIPVSFALNCVATTGSLEVTSVTSGIDQVSSGYTIRLDGMPHGQLALNGMIRIHGIPPGDHLLRLELPQHCVAAAGNERPVRITAGGTTRDTVRVSFQVSCPRVWEIAFAREGWISVASEDGAVIDTIADGWNPAWSPDGKRLAYTCVGICIASLDGNPQVTMAEHQLSAPAWRPDGRRIAVLKHTCDWDDTCHLDGLVLMDPDGRNRDTLNISPGVNWASDLDWSPNGQQLAFTCVLSNRRDSDICLINADGSGFRQLTSDSANDGSPAWKPDGKAIAFHTDRYNQNENQTDYPPVHYQIVVTGLDGASITAVSSTWGAEPSWSPDGSRLLFRGEYGLFVMNADGTGVRRITSGADYQPVWRP